MLLKSTPKQARKHTDLKLLILKLITIPLSLHLPPSFFSSVIVVYSYVLLHPSSLIFLILFCRNEREGEDMERKPLNNSK